MPRTLTRTLTAGAAALVLLAGAPVHALKGDHSDKTPSHDKDGHDKYDDHDKDGHDKYDDHDKHDKPPGGGFGHWFDDGTWETPSPSDSTFRSETGRRVVDTRSEQHPFGPGETRNYQVTGREDVVAVAVNVTAVSASTDTYLTVWDGDSPRPETSTVNVDSGGVRANAAIVEVDDNGMIAVYNSRGEVDVLVDVTGTFTGSFTPVSPRRVLDTRRDAALGPNTSRTVDVADTTVDDNVAAVVVNMTAVNATEPTYLTAWGAGTKPDTSNVNVVDGGAVANMAVIGIDKLQTVQVYNAAGTVDVLVDVIGYLDAGVGYRYFGPHRKMDTRQPSCGVPLGPGETRRVYLHAGAASSVALNVTAVDATEPTYLTVWPAGAQRPDTSTVNVRDRSATPNFTLVGTGWANQVDVYNAAGQVHLIVDVFGVVEGDRHPGSIAWCPTAPPPDKGDHDKGDLKPPAKDDGSWVKK